MASETPFGPQRQAQAARAQVEWALDILGWAWSLRLSRWLDALMTVEEGGG